MLRIILLSISLFFIGASWAAEANAPAQKAPAFTVEQGALKVLYEEQLVAARVSGGFLFSYKLLKKPAHCTTTKVRRTLMRIRCDPGWPYSLTVATPSDFAILLAKDGLVLGVRADAKK